MPNNKKKHKLTSAQAAVQIEKGLESVQMEEPGLHDPQEAQFGAPPKDAPQTPKKKKRPKK